jgi:hypothetical protein
MTDHDQLRREIADHLATYDVRPDMQRPLADVLEALIDCERKAAVEEALQRLSALPVHGDWEKDRGQVLADMFPAQNT